MTLPLHYTFIGRYPYNLDCYMNNAPTTRLTLMFAFWQRPEFQAHIKCISIDFQKIIYSCCGVCLGGKVVLV